MPETDVSGISFGLATHVGTERQVNQDSVGACVAPPGSALRGVFILADGMGGGHAGDEASQLAVSRLIEHFSQWSGDVGREALLCEMKLAISQINREIYDLSRLRGVREIGTTVDMVIVTHEDVLLAHVGDGRVYQLAETTGHQLTEDHSALNDLVKRGVPLETAMLSVGGNQVIHIVGTGGSVDPRTDPIHMDLVPGQVFALCCDGVHGGMEKSPPACIGPDDLADAVAQCPSLQSAAEAVVICAVERDGSDNATCLLVRIEPPGGQEDHPPGYQAGQAIQLPGGPVGDLSAQPVEQIATVSDLPAAPTQPGGQVAAVSDSPAATSGKIGLPFQSLRGEPKKPFNHLTAAITAAVTIFVGMVIIIIVLAMYWKGTKAPDKTDSDKVVIPTRDAPAKTYPVAPISVPTPKPDSDSKIDIEIVRELSTELQTLHKSCRGYGIDNGNRVPMSADSIKELAKSVAEASHLWNRILPEPSTNSNGDRTARVGALEAMLENVVYHTHRDACKKAANNIYVIVEYRLLLACLKTDRKSEGAVGKWRFPPADNGTNGGQSTGPVYWRDVKSLILGLGSFAGSEDVDRPNRLAVWERLWEDKSPSGNATGQLTGFMQLAICVNKLHQCMADFNSKHKEGSLTAEQARELLKQATTAKLYCDGKLAGVVKNMSLNVKWLDTLSDRLGKHSVFVKNAKDWRKEGLAVLSLDLKTPVGQNRFCEAIENIRILATLMPDDIMPGNEKVECVTWAKKLHGDLKTRLDTFIRGRVANAERKLREASNDGGIKKALDGLPQQTGDLTMQAWQEGRSDKEELTKRIACVRECAGELRKLIPLGQKYKLAENNAAKNPDGCADIYDKATKTMDGVEKRLTALKAGQSKLLTDVRKQKKFAGDGIAAGFIAQAKKIRDDVVKAKESALGQKQFVDKLRGLYANRSYCQQKSKEMEVRMHRAINYAGSRKVEYQILIKEWPEDMKSGVAKLLNSRGVTVAFYINRAWAMTPEKPKASGKVKLTFTTDDLKRICEELIADLKGLEEASRKEPKYGQDARDFETIILKTIEGYWREVSNRRKYEQMLKDLIEDHKRWKTEHKVYLDHLARIDKISSVYLGTRLGARHKRVLRTLVHDLLKTEKLDRKRMDRNWVKGDFWGTHKLHRDKSMADVFGLEVRDGRVVLRVTKPAARTRPSPAKGNEKKIKDERKKSGTSKKKSK